MKFSYNWIREFVPGLTQAPAPLERLITMKTAECEGIEEDRRAARDRSRRAGGIRRAYSREPQREGS